MKGSIEIESFSIDGKWGYAYKKGLFRWSDSGTFHLAFKKLRVKIIMSIRIEPDKTLRSFWMRSSIFIRGSVRPSVGRSVGSSKHRKLGKFVKTLEIREFLQGRIHDQQMPLADTARLIHNINGFLVPVGQNR